MKRSCGDCPWQIIGVKFKWGLYDFRTKNEKISDSLLTYYAQTDKVSRMIRQKSILEKSLNQLRREIHDAKRNEKRACESD